MSSMGDGGMMFVVLLSMMLVGALISLTALFLRASDGPIYLRRRGRAIRWDSPAQW